MAAPAEVPADPAMADLSAVAVADAEPWPAAENAADTSARDTAEAVLPATEPATAARLDAPTPDAVPLADDAPAAWRT